MYGVLSHRERNSGGVLILDFAVYEFMIVNTYFEKKEHLVTLRAKTRTIRFTSF